LATVALSAEVEAHRPFSAARKAALVVEILVAYVRVRRLLRRSDLPSVVATLRAPLPAHAAASPGGVRLGRRLSHAVVRTLRVLPTDSRCLMRSLVLTALLAERGVSGSVVVSVTPGAEFSAHAWVEHLGVELLPALGGQERRLLEL
jgi:hypothetical protein